MKLIPILITFLLFHQAAFAGQLPSRYYHSGDGRLNISSSNGNASFNGVYRKSDGTYDVNALKDINRVFNTKYGSDAASVSLRLIEFLDYLGDHFNPKAKLTVHSGYRNPTYNTKLRESGKLAAKASLHQYAMAVDVKIAGVSSKEVWDYVKEIGFGGVGFYHGALFHADVGPARSWDETTSGVGTDISDNNKLIGIIADKDIYIAGEKIVLRFIRMTAFPVGVSPVFYLEMKKGNDQWKNIAEFNPLVSTTSRPHDLTTSRPHDLTTSRPHDLTISRDKECSEYSDIPSMASFTWDLSKDLPAGDYRVVAKFCGNIFEGMPKEVITPEFEIK